MRKIAAALIFLSSTALAADFPTEVDDRAVLFTPVDLARIQQPHPYRLRVLTERDSQGGFGLLERAKAAVDSRQTVVIAVDPEHRKTFVRYGSDTGIKDKDADAIAASGNMAFRDKRWGDGVIDILHRTETSMGAPRVATEATVVEIRETPTTAYVGVSIALLSLFGLGAFLWWARKREARFTAIMKQAGEEAEALQARNVEQETWHREMRTRVEESKKQQEEAAARRKLDAEMAQRRKDREDEEAVAAVAAPDPFPRRSSRASSSRTKEDRRSSPPYTPQTSGQHYQPPRAPSVNVVSVDAPTYYSPPPPAYNAPSPSSYASRSSSSSYGSSGGSSSYGGSSGGGSSWGGSSGSSSWGSSSSSSDSSGSSSSWSSDSGGSSSSDSSSSSGGSSDW